MALADPPSLLSRAHASSIYTSTNSNWATPGIPELLREKDASERKMVLYPADLALKLDGLRIDDVDTFTALESIDTQSLDSGRIIDPSESAAVFPNISIDYFDKPRQNVLHDSAPGHKGPFHKWMRSLHRRARHRPAVWDSNVDGISWQHLESKTANRVALHRRLGHRKSSSGSSFGFVSAMQSASASLASVSAVTRSRRNTTRSHCQSRTDRSSRASFSGYRLSEDSMTRERPVTVDTAATERSFQRRKILEELISTEESYIGDVRFLMNVYITILASLPTLPMRLRSSINRNLTEIVELHEELLGDLHRVIPHSEYTQLDFSLSLPKPKNLGNGHRRWWSHDGVPESQIGAAWLQNVPGMVSEPQVAAEVAKIFGKKMNRFFIYKEYGAKYEMMIKDVASAHQTMPEWETYQKGLEALSSTFGSARSSGNKSKKSLTTGDLLVKPIQRVCKYPLLFAELLKCTPICDCPNSHMEVETALMRLREATAEINRATNDDHMKTALEKTWLLQDRLVFPKRKLDAASKNQIRSFGHIQLCGALHVCWQTKDSVEGQYMICLLYRDLLCLASAGKVDPIYTIQACISMNGAKVEDVDNGRGLQCHTAPFSWKLVFEGDHQLYELIMTACSSREETKWRERLCQQVGQEPDAIDPNLYNSLSLNMKSLGTVFGKPGTVARRISIHRATTVGPKSPLCQVVLKNTSIATNHVPSQTRINRSQSLLTTNSRIPVLAPARSERTRLEILLADIWSRDVLPFPGMLSRSRSEHLVRNSASTMMKKLSVASITGSFSKRPGGATHRAHGNEEPVALGGTVRHISKSSDCASECSAGPHAGTGRLSKRPRTRCVREQNYSQDTPAAFTFELAETTVPGWAMDLAGTASATIEIGEDQEARSLRTSATNSVQLSSSNNSEKSISVSIAKENACTLVDNTARSHGRRWGRAGVARLEGKGQGLRSLFR
ncbi:RSP protein [Dactylonectria estremocensis]|uniref:RSP protein n=1 Tax=Dactylonectria estremocensis TaxID=1079267 RepID=A0A9P9IVJ7_9HYPO|nr:RSP protein [Dactylonectria estremocensis]